MMTPPRVAVHRLALGRFISITGSAAAFTALMFTIYSLTGSAAWLAASLLVTEGVSGLLAPLASALSDRFDRRRVMIVSDLAAAVCSGAMATVHTAGPLVALAFAAAVAEAPFWPTSGAAIPNLVPPEQVSWANSLVSVGRNAGVTAGPAIGGALLWAVGPSWVFAINAASFVVSAALIWSVHARFSEDRTGEDEHGGIRAGFRFMLRESVLRRLAAAWIVFSLGIGMVMVADVPLVRLFHGGSGGYGAMIALWGAGSVLGSLAGRWLTPRNEARWLVLSMVFVGATGFGIATAPWFWAVLALNLAWGLGEGVISVADQNIVQRRTPDAVRGRVMGAFEGVFHGTLVVSFLGAAVVVPALGPRGIYAIGGVAALLAAVALLPLLRGRPTASAPEPGGPSGLVIADATD